MLGLRPFLLGRRVVGVVADAFLRAVIQKFSRDNDQYSI